MTLRAIASSIVACLAVCLAAFLFPSAGAAPAAPDTGSPPPSTAQFFDAKVAPLLARHCLECHDTATKKGKLDLSRKDAALAGDEDGPVILPGKAAESRLWKAVEADEMPEDRPPLTTAEKQVLRQWIDAGATWSGNEIDPFAVYRDGRAAQEWLRRLTVPEYVETVRAAVGVDIEQDARRILPPDLRADGFSNTAYNLNVDLAHVEAYGKLAALIVSKTDVKAFASQFSHHLLRYSRVLARQKSIGHRSWWLHRQPCYRVSRTRRGAGSRLCALQFP